MKQFWHPLLHALALWVVVSGTEAQSSEYTIINTGIKGGGCWYDDSHFVIVKGHQPAPGQEFEVEGLYYLDPAKPKDLRRIDLSPLEPSLQKQIRDVTCQDQTILFYVTSPGRKQNQLYLLKIGQPPILFAEKIEGFVVPRAVNVKSRYVLGFTSALQTRGLESSTTPEQAKEDCLFAYLHAEYRVVCLRHDRGRKLTWLANNVFLSQYIWDETIRVNKDGAYEWIPNPELPVRLADGTELKYGYLLRDFENRVVQQIKMEQPPYQIYRIPLKLDPQGEHLYANCSKAGDHGDKHYTEGGRVCRFKLDGKNRMWEEVFAVQQSPKDPYGLQDLDVNAQGDVVVIDRGHSLNQSIWKYTASSRKVESVTRAALDLGVPLISPDGRWVSFILRGEFYLAHHKGDRP